MHSVTFVALNHFKRTVGLSGGPVVKNPSARTLFDINHSKILYDPPPRVMEIKTKINKWVLIK